MSIKCIIYGWADKCHKNHEKCLIDKLVLFFFGLSKIHVESSRFQSKIPEGGFLISQNDQ